MDNNRSYRIRTIVGNEKPFKIDVPLTQTYDMFEILSLKLKQKNEYNFYDSNYGVIVGRVLANGNFGIPNAKISVFIEVDAEESISRQILYNFTSAQSVNFDGVKYNLLPDFVDNACHQDVGTFPNKRLVLDNNDILEIFDKYYKYTTVTNESGDYMLFGIPTGMQNVHVDIDMSDIGQLSQRPRDMVYKGYNINQFESPNKFKQSTNLNSLAQLYSQDKGVFVYSYWGNSNNRNESGEDNIAITRCDFQIEYKFEPTCIFIGSIVTDKGSNAIGKNCTGTDNIGKMSDLSAGEGTIEMIRKTVDGKVEEFQIKGNRLIDGDGVWCYQIPMNLDYIMTDEFGNIVPTDDPSKGIPTRTRARFRISLDDSPNDATARKRCRFLVPNNPRYDEIDFPQFYKSKEADYEFGSATREESYCDMFWNNVYTVKSYIPRLQKNKNSTNRKHTGIKLINHYGDNNPMPYNSLSIKLSFTYRLICVLVKVLIWIIATINQILAFIMEPLCWIGEMFLSIAKGLCFSILGIKPLCWLGQPFKVLGKLFKSMVVKGITLGSNFCDDGINRIAFYPILTKISPCVLDKVKNDFNKEQNDKTNPEERERLKIITITSMDNNELITCIENNLAQSNDATSFNFQNDWVNGVLYAPLWYRKITPKKSFLFGLFKKKAKDQWCRSDGNFNLMLYQACALDKTSNKIKSPIDDKDYEQVDDVKTCGDNCHEKKIAISVNNGLILTKETMLGQTVYYYKAIEYNQQLANSNKSDGVILLFATDIVLLGSLNDCDSNGIPQFFKSLESTTYNLPTDILFTDTIIQVDAEGNVVVNKNNDIVFEQFTEATGCDWGNLNPFDECGKMGESTDGGLFYGIGCSTIEMTAKSCLNLSRICEFGVSLDEAKDVANLNMIQSSDSDFERLTPDGFISFDELYNINERSMFATLNGNRLRTRLNNKNGLKEYDLRYLYTDNFDGLMRNLMKNLMKKSGDCNYVNNHYLEQMSNDYYMFRMGTEPYFYDSNLSLPRYENSFYFYFGLKMGKTAIDKFNSQFFATCENSNGVTSPISVEVKPNSWCTDDSEAADGYVLIDLSNIPLPCDIILNSEDILSLGFSVLQWNNDKLFIGKYDNLSDKEKEDISEYVGKHYDINLLYKDDQNNPIEIDYIPNGNYELIITDSEGQIISYKFSMMPQRLQFTYTKTDNEIPNNQRLDENDNWQDLLNIKISNTNYIDYGGYIIIDSIINGDLTEGKYRLEVLLKENEKYDDFVNDYKSSIIFNVDSNGNINGVDGIDTKKIIRWIGNRLVIITPLGDIDYKIKITELCENGNTSLNFMEIYVRVNDTLPYKLFVNDVDVSALKNINTLWNIGWNNAIKETQINSLGKAWLDLDNEEYYDFEKLEGFEKLETDEEKDKFKKDFIDSVKDTFWLTSTFLPKDIIITVQTKKLPVEYHLHYNEEESSDKGSVNKLIGEGNVYVNAEEDKWTVYSINDILIPTITSKDNEDYGYNGNINSAKTGNISFGYDRINGINDKGNYVNDNKWLKKPYGIRVINAKEDKLPVKGNIKIKMDGDKNSEEYFFFHIIDKVLSINNMLVWSYVNDIPYYGSEVDKRGHFIKMNGLFTGVINNGIVKEDGQFTECTLGKENIKITTINKETVIPTVRNLNTVSNNPYIAYDVNYVPVQKKQDVLNIEDTKGNYISETVYGNMNIKLNTFTSEIITFNLNNGDNYGINKFYLIEGDADYPLNKNMSLTIDKWYKNGAYGIMSYGEKIANLYDKSSTKLEGETPTDEKPEQRDSKGYSTNGSFRIKRRQELGKFFIVVVTSNNCRTISPLYDNADVSINAILAELNTIVDNGDGTYNNIIDYKFAIELDKIPYYIEYFNSKLSLDFKINEQLKIEGENEFRISNEGMALNSEDKIVYFNIDTTMYEQLKTYFSNNILFNFIKNKIKAVITDITNLPLNATVNSYQTNKSRKDIFYAIVWDLSDFEESAITSVDLSRYYKTGTTVFSPVNEDPQEKNGYNYKGWESINKDGNIKSITFPYIMPSESVILKPQYKKIEFVFNCGAGLWNDGSQLDRIVELDGNTLTIGELPILTNKVFKTWNCIEITDYTISDDKLKIEFANNIANINYDKITFIAQFE